MARLPEKEHEPIGCWIALIVAGLLIVGCGFGGCTMMGKGFSYSDGYRDGHIQKFSKKGFFVKTYEGEMALPGFKAKGDPGDGTTNVFCFTVDNPDIIAQIEALDANDYVRISYDQRKCHSPFVSESDYFVTKVEKLKKHD